MIRTSYDPEADAFAVRFAAKGVYLESQEVAPGIILDFDATGQVIGIEVLYVRDRMAAGAEQAAKKPAAAE